ncbi:MAG: hypothetical protein K6E20_05315 [Acholeplasmatales bacterium]|nr:hypothetical protein [Acholeplasmatales bacterium]
MKITKKSIFAIVECALFVIAIFMMFAPFLKAGSGEYAETANGFEIAFGDEGLAFSFMMFLSFLFLIAGAVLACCKLFVKDAKVQMIFNIVILVVGVLAGIFFFCTKTTMMVKVEDLDSDYVKEMLKLYDLGVGAIFTGILAIAGGAVACVDQFLIKE